MDLSRLVPFRRSIRPVNPNSLPQFLDNELDRVAVVTNNLVQAIIDLEARVAALEAPPGP